MPPSSAQPNHPRASSNPLLRHHDLEHRDLPTIGASDAKVLVSPWLHGGRKQHLGTGRCNPLVFGVGIGDFPRQCCARNRWNVAVVVVRKHFDLSVGGQEDGAAAAVFKGAQDLEPGHFGEPGNRGVVVVGGKKNSEFGHAPWWHPIDY